MDRKKSKLVAREQRKTELARKRTKPLAVVGGDHACMRQLARLWGGKRAAGVLRSPRDLFWISDRARREYLAFVMTATASLDPWPGGAIVWLFPDRGPSEPELSIMRQFLTRHLEGAVVLRVFLCMDDDVDEADAAIVLDVVSRTLEWAVDCEAGFTAEAIWFSRLDPQGLTDALKGSVA